MTQIELFGCTSAGKSTLARGVLQACQEQGVDLLMGDDLVLEQLGLNWIRSKLVRTLVTDLSLLSVCLGSWGTYRKFCTFAIQVILRLPIARLEKLNLARNVLKRIGNYEIISRRNSDQRVVLVDQGTLQAAHHLFVHVSADTNADDLLTFVRLVPLPDAAIYVTQDEPVLIKRTMERGHKRIPHGSYAAVESFIKQAVDAFNIVAQQIVLERNFVAMDGQRNVLVAGDCRDDPSLAAALEIVHAEMDG